MTQNQLANAVAQAVAAALAGGKVRKQRADKGFTKSLVNEAQNVDQRKAAFEAATVKAFNKAGYADVQPRINVLTYGKVKDDGTKTGWLSQGRKVKRGEKAVYVKAPGMYGKGMPMFHLLQTEEIVASAPTTDTVQ